MLNVVGSNPSTWMDIFFSLIFYQNSNVCLKNTKISEKEPEMAQFKKAATIVQWICLNPSTRDPDSNRRRAHQSLEVKNERNRHNNYSLFLHKI